MKIHELIIETIQGEGSNAGMPCDFVRLHGCNVGCWFCDTGYSKENLHGSKIPFEDLSFSQIYSKLKSYNIVISGGEPMLVKELPEFCQYLIDRGKRIFIETSGTAWRELPPEVWITLSPKNGVSKLQTKQEASDYADEIKFIVSCRPPAQDFIPYYGEIVRDLTQEIYFQPEASEFLEDYSNVMEILELIKSIPNAKLSLQTHKILNLP